MLFLGLEIYFLNNIALTSFLEVIFGTPETFNIIFREQKASMNSLVTSVVEEGERVTCSVPARADRLVPPRLTGTGNVLTSRIVTRNVTLASSLSRYCRLHAALVYQSASQELLGCALCQM